MSSNTLSKPPYKLWTSTEGQDFVRELVTELIPQWKDGPREFQSWSWVRSLDGVIQFVFMASGGGKTALFFVPILIAIHLNHEASDHSGMSR